MYQARVHGVYQIFTRSIGRASVARITNSSQSCNWPFWSPDGLTIYYGSGGGLWAVGTSGGTPQLVMKNKGVAAIHPDGKTFAFIRDGKLILGPPDEGKQHEYRQEPFPSEPSFLDVRFSPDGSKLAAALVGRLGHEGELWILPFPSGTPRRIASGSFDSVSWFPDNSRVLLTRRLAAGDSAVVLERDRD